MGEVAAVAAVYGLITGSVAIIRLSIDIYNAVEDKSGIPERLRKVSEKLQPLKALLQNAQDRYDSKQLGHQIWADAENDFKRCHELCKDLHDLLVKVYPEKEATKSGRFWKNTKTVLSGKGKTAEQLLKDIWGYLDVFAKKGIVTNTALLQEIKDVVEELSPDAGSRSAFYHSGIGDQVAGDKVSGNKNQQRDNGRMYNAPINTINEAPPLQVHTYQAIETQHIYNHSLRHLKDPNERRRPSEEECTHALFLTDPSIERDKLVQIKGQRAPGTCEWITRNESFQTWQKGSLRSLWIRGKPGKGKTMIAIFLSRTLDAENGIYYFCVAADTQGNNATSILRGILWQLVCRHPQLKSELPRLFETEEHAAQAVSSAETLWNILMFLALNSISQIDLDNSVASRIGTYPDEIFSAGMQELFGPTPPRNATVKKTLTTSRDIPGLPALDSISQTNPKVSVAPGIGTDIEIFVLTSVQELSERVSLGAASLKQISRILLQRAEGTFLWIGFAMAALLEAQTELEIMRAINSQGQLPAGLVPMLERILSSIDLSNREMSIKILRWVTISAVPLSLEELAFVVRCEPEGTMSEIDTMKDHVRLCGPVLENNGATVGFVHESVRDYLARSAVDENDEMEMFRVKGEEAHVQAALACLHAVEVGGPLARYAASYWHHHVRHSGELADDLIEQEAFFQQHSSSRDGCWSQSGHRWLNTLLPRLHFASSLGLTRWIRAIVAEENCAVDEIDAYGRSPLDHAITHGHTAVVQLLIRHGASAACIDLETLDRLFAYRESSKDLIRLLRPHCAGLVAEDTSPWHTALTRAVSRGSQEMVRFLGELGVNMSHANIRGETVMFTLFKSSSVSGSAVNDMLKVLQEFGQGPDPYATNAHGQTLLHVTAWEGRHIELMLNIGCDVTAVDDLGNTPLHFSASGPADAQGMRLLVSRGASISAKNHSGKTALHMAAERDQVDGHRKRELLTGDKLIGHKTRMLLEHGADPNCVDDTGSSPLHCWASIPNGGASPELLLEYGADIEACNDARARPLHNAVRRGRHARADNAKALLEHGADVDAREGCGRRALHLAVSSKNSRMVEMLFDFGADLNAPADGGLTPLHYAVWGDDEPMAMLLLHLEADIETKDNGGWSVLHIAALEGRTSMVELLLNAKADVNAKGAHGLTALHLAAFAGHTKTVALLLGSGADSSAQGIADTMLGRPSVTALDLAAWRRHADIKRILRDHRVAQSSFPLILFFLLIDILRYLNCFRFSQD